MSVNATEKLWLERKGQGPLMATAVHAGHEVRRELLPLFAIHEADRAREEDPYTDYWVKVVPTWLVPQRSRFEVDLNRPRDEAVYVDAEMAWGLHLWEHKPTERMIARSLAEYDAFYAELRALLDDMAEHHHHFVVFDLHAYNYRRRGSEAAPAEPRKNPDVNVGTGTLDRSLFGALVERFKGDLRRFDFLGHHLDVRENVRFRGRELARWIHSHYPRTACVLAIEFKKFYMNEWTGVGDVEQIQAVRDALQFTVPGVLDELERLQ